MVATVGVKTNETLALKEANVGIVMGTWSSELARESSKIIIWDSDFRSLVTIFSCGRCAYDNIQNYIQLEITIVISKLLITTIIELHLGVPQLQQFPFLHLVDKVVLLGEGIDETPNMLVYGRRHKGAKCRILGSWQEGSLCMRFV
ncbi:hypothetical protein Pint_18827 [Pistacia integerrima]|uniref:Uncharacterized protein n=1 Tax=Pistacia integerrima TaxID=434235 RepID=A0ACC0YZP7_9ROSI|nr:hypothetical protein Pint_18827 [Pistacia integerrima]